VALIIKTADELLKTFKQNNFATIKILIAKQKDLHMAGLFQSLLIMN